MNRLLLKISGVALLLLAAGTTVATKAQTAGIKTNVLYWAAGGTLNLGVEVKVAPKVTLDLGVSGNPFRYGKKELNRKIWHWAAQPEARFWLHESFHGGFIGVNSLFGSYDAGGIGVNFLGSIRNHRYEGWMAGVGASFGWQWYISPHWNVEATIGLGYMYLRYNRFGCETCSEMDTYNAVEHYVGPTKLGVSFIYLFGSKK